jgi:hypothetical protein
MNLNRTLVSVAVLASALAAAGCNADAFNALNANFKSIKSTSKTISNSTLPAAAMATNIAIVELMNAMASDTQSKLASKVIAVGGGNYRVPQFAVQQAAETSSKLDEDSKTGTLVSKRDGKSIVEATYAFERTAKDGGFVYAIKNFKGKVSGFEMTAEGSFSYIPKAGAGAYQVAAIDPATIACKVSGALKTDATSLKLDTLEFNAAVPMPANVPNLGALKMSDDKKNAISCTVAVSDNRVTAQGEMRDEKGNLLYGMTMDENGVKTTTGADAQTK